MQVWLQVAVAFARPDSTDTEVELTAVKADVVGMEVGLVARLLTRLGRLLVLDSL